MRVKEQSLDSKICDAIAFLGVDPAFIAARKLPQYEDAKQLVIADYSASGRTHELVPEAAAAWKNLKTHALDHDVSLIIISAFRSFERQFEIIESRIESGEIPVELFRKLAPPGCSQHHTGRAMDIGTYGCEPASEDFANTKAFEWLQSHASEHGFTMPYPEDNQYGYFYEPWHWYFSV